MNVDIKIDAFFEGLISSLDNDTSQVQIFYTF